MAYQSLVVDRVFFVRWQSPAMSDVLPLLRAVQKAAGKVGGPVIGVSILPEDSPPPTDDVRKAMARSMEDMLAVADSLHFIMEGDGFRHSIGRNALATILLFSANRKRIFVHPTVQAALTSVASKLTKGVPEILDMASKQGILSQKAAARVR
jgi:hypothetical protein